MPQAGRRQVDQPLGQADGRGVRRAQQRDVGHATKLFGQRGIQARMAVPVDVAPQAAHGIQILAAVDVDQRRAVGPLENQRPIFGHLRERMPEDLAIPALEFVRVG